MENSTLEIPKKPARQFVSENFDPGNWSEVEPRYKDLAERNIDNADDLNKWLQDWSELDAVISENLGWRHINMTCDTANKEFVDSYNFFITEIEPKIAPWQFKLQKKFDACPFTKELDPVLFRNFFRQTRNAISIFREENIPLVMKMNQESQKYGSICGALTITWDGKEITLPQAANLLKEGDRSRREEAFRKVQEKRKSVETDLDNLLNTLVEIRNQIGLNAGFKNFRDYKFVQLGRFDYSVEDCRKFHNSVSGALLPLVEKIDRKRKEKLKVNSLRPWDMEVDVSGKGPLKPFEGAKDLIQKTVHCFRNIDSWFSERIEIMNEMGHFDLESRKGKAPGGYNYPLYEIGVPFIFMNAAGSQRDLVTMVHEGGHAVHSFLTRDLELTEFKGLPSEVAELASMSMELISMEHWDSFYSDKNDLKRARKEQLEKILRGILWIARVDNFQHWLYENPAHTAEERKQFWMQDGKRFTSSVIDWSGLEEFAAIGWQGQLHIYEVPFYYIEYGFAQLGALAMWRNYLADPQKTIGQYKEALKLGYTRSIPEIYQTAGITFDFSPEYVSDLVSFVVKKYAELDED